MRRPGPSIAGIPVLINARWACDASALSVVDAAGYFHEACDTTHQIVRAQWCLGYGKCTQSLVYSVASEVAHFK